MEATSIEDGYTRKRTKTPIEVEGYPPLCRTAFRWVTLKELAREYGRAALNIGMESLAKDSSDVKGGGRIPSEQHLQYGLEG